LLDHLGGLSLHRVLGLHARIRGGGEKETVARKRRWRETGGGEKEAVARKRQ
jgi:hypothetical protein